MSKKQWLVLLGLYALYLLLGALVFKSLEAPQALEEKKAGVERHRRLQHIALETLVGVSASNRDDVLDLISATEHLYGPILPSHFNASMENNELAEYTKNNSLSEDDMIVDHNWDLWNSFFFSFITITTIGYGHLSPNTPFGQVFCIIYSLFGIPLNTLVFVALAGFYSEHVLTEEDRAGGGGRSTGVLVGRAIFYLTPGVFLFLIVPAIIVMLVEDWTFLESFYFAFISLTTIGYGDFVAGHPSHYGVWDVLYKAYIMVWTMFGLGYIIMVITFLIDAFKSDHVKKVEKKTRLALQQRTARLQKLVQSFVAQHEEDHRKEHIKEVVYAMDQGKDNAGFSTTESEIINVEKKTDQCIHAHILAEVSKPSRRRKSIVEIVGKMFQDHPPLTQRKLSMSVPTRRSSVARSRRPSIQIDRHGTCCQDLQALVDLVAAVEDLVDQPDEVGNEQEVCTNSDGGEMVVEKTELPREEKIDITLHM